jgi:hypothetical protein
MTRRIALTFLALAGALAAALPAHAQAPTDLNRVPVLQGNVIGGGGASLAGGGDDRTITYSATGAGGGARYEQTGRVATFASNSGGSPSWTYGPAPQSAPGREAWLLGGGEDTQVVYLNPAGAAR